MRARVVFRLPSGEIAEAGPGEVVGRGWSAAVRVDDPRLSEAHALVSLRASELKLLALRGPFGVDGRPVSEVSLSTGLVVELAVGLQIEVEEVDVPEHVLALRGLAAGPTVLAAPVCSIVAGSPPRLVARHVADAAFRLWASDDGWMFQPSDGPAAPLLPGTTLQVSDHALEAVLVESVEGSQPETRPTGRVHGPLRIVARFDSVHIHRTDRPVAVLSGAPARLVSELVAMGGLAGWEAIARELWPAEADRVLLRQKWDRTLQTLRAKLREHRIRPELIHADGHGHLELLLVPGDEVVDDT